MEKVFDFLHKIEKLKSTLRFEGNTASGRPESAAEHSWRLALMIFSFAKELKIKVDVCRAIKMAIVHDLAESITGDVDAVRIADGEITVEKKRDMEVQAMKDLTCDLSGVGREINGLWEEYEDGKTNEARFVKALDKIETLTHICEEGYKFYDRPEFIPNYADNSVKKFPELTEALMIVKRKLKEEYSKGNIEWKEEYN